jgi:uroporphyrinogen decarboxylase
MDNFLVDLMCETANVQKLLDELLKSHLAKLEKLCNAVGVTANIIRFGDDNGRTQDTFMESEIYRQLFKPQHKVLCDYVREHGRIHTFIHFYDSIPLFMSDLIDAGIKIFNPVQTNVYFMEFEFLKNEFGKDCTFWDGGIETSGALNNGISQ